MNLDKYVLCWAVKCDRLIFFVMKLLVKVESHCKHRDAGAQQLLIVMLLNVTQNSDNFYYLR